MSDWLSWAKQPFSSNSDSKQEEKASHPPPSGKKEREEQKVDSSSASTSSSSSSSAVSSWLPSLPSLSLPSFLSTSSTASSNASNPSLTDNDPPPPYPLPSISSSPSTNTTTSPLINPPPADVSYLRTLLASFTSASSASAPPQPTSGLTPSGLRWEKVEGVKGFALSEAVVDDSKEQAAQHVISDEELAHVRQICQQLQQQQGSTHNAASPTRPPVPSTAFTSSLGPSPATELHTHTRSAVVVNNTNESSTATGEGDDSNEHEVAILDVDNIDWWTLVDPSHDKAAAQQYNIEEGYVVIQHSDTVDAMAVYLSQVLVNHPHASRLSGRELAAVIDRALRPLEERRGWLGGVGGSRYVTYGYYAYLVYSWTATAYSLYRRPWLVKLAATGAMQAASWLWVLFI